MINSVPKIFNLETIKALRGDVFRLDLGKTFSGTLKAQMKKDPNDQIYREFTVENNRYLSLSSVQTSDYKDNNGIITNSIAGKWFFDVEQTENNETKTIFTGVILFKNDITNSGGIEAS